MAQGTKSKFFIMQFFSRAGQAPVSLTSSHTAGASWQALPMYAMLDLANSELPSLHLEASHNAGNSDRRSLKRAVQMQAGQREVFMDNLPGYPDGITKGSEGTYWLSLVTLKSPALEFMLNSRYVNCQESCFVEAV